MGNKSTQIGKTQFWVSFLPVRTNLKSGKLVIHQQQKEEKQVAAKAASQTLLAKRLLPLAPASRSPRNIFSEIKLDSPPFVTTKMFQNNKK